MSDIGLIVADPGHFHAALVQKERDPKLSAKVQVYAPVGPDLVDYLTRISRFNTRREQPTAWELEVRPRAGERASPPAPATSPSRRRQASLSIPFSLPTCAKVMRASLGGAREVPGRKTLVEDWSPRMALATLTDVKRTSGSPPGLAVKRRGAGRLSSGGRSGRAQPL